MILAQTLQSNIKTHTLVLNEPMIKLGTINDIKSKFSNSEEIIIDIDFDIPEPVKEISYALTFKTDEKYQYVEEEIFIESMSKYFNYYLSNNIDEIQSAIEKETRNNIVVDNSNWIINSAFLFPVVQLKIFCRNQFHFTGESPHLGTVVYMKSGIQAIKVVANRTP